MGCRRGLRARPAALSGTGGTRVLVVMLRSAVLAGSLAAAWLVGTEPARGQVDAIPAVELRAIARGDGGFIVRGQGGPECEIGRTVSGAGDVDGDGVPDAIVAGLQVYVVFGKTDGTPVELSEVPAGEDGFLIRRAGRADNSVRSVSGGGDVNGDGLADLVVGVPVAGIGDRDDAGESYVVFGKKGSAPVELSEVRAGKGGFVIRGAAENDRSGWSVSGGGDVNGDGLADLVVGAPDVFGDGRTSTGRSYVVFGKADGVPVELSGVESGEGGFVIRGAGDSDDSGASVSAAGDVNGDGLADLVVGAPIAHPRGGSGAGESYVVFGKTGGTPVELSGVQESDGGFVIRGAGEGHHSGASVSGAGDVNGDGLADVVLGAPRADPGGREDAGESYVVFGKPDGLPVELSGVSSGEGGFAMWGSAADDRSGTSVSGAGDVNGDGLADVLVGASHADPGGEIFAGESYVVFGKRDGAPVDLSGLGVEEDGFVIRGISERDQSALGLSDAGDMNGDGLADLLVGAPYADPEGRPQAGESYIIFGKADGAPVELSDIRRGVNGFVMRGAAGRRDWQDQRVSGAGDVNGDGLTDIVIGTPEFDPDGRYRAGETYVVFGRPGGTPVELADVRRGEGGFSIRGAVEFVRSGSVVAGGGDVNGDGLTDLLVATSRPEHLPPRGAGESYVVFGKAGGERVELSDVQKGQGGFVIRRDELFHARLSNAGDVNGDGLADILVGAPHAHSVGQGYAGASFVVFGKADSLPVELSGVEAGEGGFVIRGVAAGDLSGSSVSRAGDVNGDGLGDLLVGARGADLGGRVDAGTSYAVFGKADGRPVELSDVEAGEGGFAIRGIGELGASGRRVSAAGDVDGDRLADVIIGAHLAKSGVRSTAGESYVVFGKTDGKPVELADVQTGESGFAIRGAAAGDLSGASVSGAGDVNGDGLADLLVGAVGADPGGQRYAGETYIVFGKTNGRPVELSDVQTGEGGVVIRGATKDDTSGRHVSGAGDVDGDGLPDVVIASRLAGGRYTCCSGATYVVFGREAWRGAAPEFRRGAARGGESLEIADAIAILGFLFLRGDTPACLDAADADDSGRIEVTDAVRVLGFLFRGGEELPAPGPFECGTDPTPDALDCTRPVAGC